MRVKGNTVLLTGATGGLGHAIARGLAERGADLVLTGRKETELKALAAEVGGRALVADLADADGVRALVDEVSEVDVLVANAALPANGKLTDFTTDEVRRALSVNLDAPIALTHALLPGMVERRRGHVVLIGSVAGKVSMPFASLYNATKFGLRGFALGVRQDVAGTGVGVSVVQPGMVRDAGMFADSGAKPPTGMRTVSPRQVSDAVVEAIEKDRAEITVAPVELRVVSTLGSAFPGFVEAFLRRSGSDELMAEIAESNKAKR